MRAHGWGGDPPADDDQARARIIGATMRCLDRFGPHRTHLADVAAELGVTRQTVYRYFATTEDLLVATATTAADAFLDHLVAHVADCEDVPGLIAEAIAYTLERLPTDPYLTLLLQRGSTATFTQGIMSPTAMSLGRSILRRFPVDWASAGFSGDDLDGLAEFMLRTLMSFVVDPGERDGTELRGFLRRWIGPAVLAVPLTSRDSASVRR